MADRRRIRRTGRRARVIAAALRGRGSGWQYRKTLYVVRFLSGGRLWQPVPRESAKLMKRILRDRD